MPVETLEALRLVSNLETEKRKLVQVVLFGQPLGFLSISFVDALIGSTTLYCLIRIRALERQQSEAGIIR